MIKCTTVARPDYPYVPFGVRIVQRLCTLSFLPLPSVTTPFLCGPAFTKSFALYLFTGFTLKQFFSCIFFKKERRLGYVVTSEGQVWHGLLLTYRGQQTIGINSPRCASVPCSIPSHYFPVIARQSSKPVPITLRWQETDL